MATELLRQVLLRMEEGVGGKDGGGDGGFSKAAPGRFGEPVLLFGESDRGISEIHKVMGQV